MMLKVAPNPNVFGMLLCDPFVSIWDCRIEGYDCVTSHEDLRAFRDAECLEEASHFVDVSAGNVECIAIKDPTQCDENNICYWSVPSFRTKLTDLKSGAAGSAHLIYGFTILGFERSVAFPKPSTRFLILETELKVLLQVFFALSEHVLDEIQEAADNSEIESWDDVLVFEPSPFECPETYKEVVHARQSKAFVELLFQVCDYADALTLYLINNVYCVNKYPRLVNSTECQNDDHCSYDASNGGCIPSDDVYNEAIRSAQTVTFVRSFLIIRFCRSLQRILTTIMLERMNWFLWSANTLLKNPNAMVFESFVSQTRLS